LQAAPSADDASGIAAGADLDLHGDTSGGHHNHRYIEGAARLAASVDPGDR
jgi:hypothetical protein